MDAYLAQEPCNDVSKHDRLVSFVIVWWSGDPCEIPQIAFPLVEPRVLATGIEEKDPRSTFDEPTAVKAFYSCATHCVQSRSEVGVVGLLRFDFHRCSLVAERAYEAVSLAKLGDGDGDLGLDDGVDTTDFIRDFPSTFKEQGISDIPLDLAVRHRRCWRWCMRVRRASPGGKEGEEGEEPGVVAAFGIKYWLGFPTERASLSPDVTSRHVYSFPANVPVTLVTGPWRNGMASVDCFRAQGSTLLKSQHDSEDLPTLPECPVTCPEPTAAQVPTFQRTGWKIMERPVSDDHILKESSDTHSNRAIMVHFRLSASGNTSERGP